MDGLTKKSKSNGFGPKGFSHNIYILGLLFFVPANAKPSYCENEFPQRPLPPETVFVIGLGCTPGRPWLRGRARGRHRVRGRHPVRDSHRVRSLCQVRSSHKIFQLGTVRAADVLPEPTSRSLPPNG